MTLTGFSTDNSAAAPATTGQGLGLTISTALANAAAAAPSAAVVSPRNDFVVSQRTADYELSRVDTLSLEEQEIMAGIQELQAQLMQLRHEEEEDSDDETTPRPSAPTASTSSQLIIVSNNLPVLLERVPQTGRWKATKTTGGLDKLMCLTGVRNDLNFLWVGWVGQHIPKHEHESVRRLLLQHNCLPVFLSSDVAARHSAFSSDVLWSLFHYVSEPVSLSNTVNYHSAKRFSKQDWRAYESANESFADAIAEIYNEGDSVWVHDYHLMMLPSLLRQRLPLCHIGWFLHTPFPASDIYSRLPVRTELLRGVLQSDLVGFQTFDYERHFVSTCQRLLGVECSHKGIRSTHGASGADRDRFTSIGVFPIGISVEPFARAASSAATLHRVNDLQRKFGTKRIILGVDRLDNIKGIPNKLLGMEQLLSRFPEWQHNVVLIQIGISSRSGVADSASNYSISTGTASSTTPSSSSSKGDPANPNPAASSGKDGVDSSSAPKAAAGTAPTTTKQPAASASLPSDASPQLEMSSESYHNLLAHVNQLVGRINGTFGTLDYSPIHFILQREMQHEELCALYDLADVCLVTSTRDGMNLVSHEFVVCQQHFMRRKDERKKAARAAARAASSPLSSVVPLLDTPPKTVAKSPAVTNLQAPDGALLSPTEHAILSPQISPTKILTEWEGEEGGPGVLIVSEFAGCSQSLSGAIVTNPWNTEDVALSIHQALGMCRAEREIRQQKLYRYVSANTATSWSMQFLNDLGDAVQQNRRSSTQLPKLDVKHIVSAYRRAKNRVIILDYDRTLTPQHALLPLAAVGPNFKHLLDTLTADESNTVFIVSARERKFLETWLQGVRVGVAAEDGFFYRMNLSNDREQWKTMSKFQYDAAARSVASTDSASGFETPISHNSRRSMSLGSVPSFAPSAQCGSHNPYANYYAPAPVSSQLFAPTATSTGSNDALSFDDGEDSSWKDLVLPTLVNFTERTPGSYIEDKESSLTWHYGDADAHFGGWQAKDLQIVLERQLIGSALEVYAGRNWVSVEHEGCTKAKVLEGILKHLSLPQQVKKKGQQEVDFVLCVCDDYTDDQMFQTLSTLVTESNERHEKKKEAEAAALEKPKRATSANATTSSSRNGQRQSVSGASSTSSGGSSAPLHRSKSSGARAQTDGASSADGLRRKSDKALRRRKTGSSSVSKRGGDLGRLAEGANEDDEAELARAKAVDEDNKVAFSRLQKVPVRMAENVSIFTLVVGQDVQHSAGRHTSSYAVDSLSDVRKVLKEFADASRPPQSQPPSQTKLSSTQATSEGETPASEPRQGDVVAQTTPTAMGGGDESGYEAGNE